MDLISQLLLALSLTADTFAVAITIGLMVANIRFWPATQIGITMATMQALLPALGWLIGIHIKHLTDHIDHWIALALLSALGLHMIYEGIKPENERKSFNPFKITVMLSLAIATSIDAFVVGISLGFTNVNIFLMMLYIGAFTYLAAMLGMLFGKTLGTLISHRIEIIGGIILILLGGKIVLESI